MGWGFARSLEKQRLLRKVTSKALIEFLYMQIVHMRGTERSSKQMDKKNTGVVK